MSGSDFMKLKSGNHESLDIHGPQSGNPEALCDPCSNVASNRTCDQHCGLRDNYCGTEEFRICFRVL